MIKNIFPEHDLLWRIRISQNVKPVAIHILHAARCVVNISLTYKIASLMLRAGKRNVISINRVFYLFDGELYLQ